MMENKMLYLGFAACTGLALIALWCARVLSTAYMTPLRRVPGPWYAKFTNLWLKFQVLQGRRLHYLHDMHIKYGNTVRTAPTEVDVTGVESFREVHRISSGFLKSPWYTRFRDSEVADVFSMIDPKVHSVRRKLFARSFTNTSLRQHWEQTVQGCVRLAIASIKAEALCGNADVFKYFTLLTTDVISQVAFGESTGLLELGKKSEYIINLEKILALAGIRAEFTGLVDALQKIPAIRNYFQAASDHVAEQGKAAISNARLQNIGKSNLFGNMLAENEKDSKSLTDMDILTEAQGFLVAGSGTTAVTLTYLVWAVLQQPTLRKQLEDEVAALKPDYDDATLETLPLLNAVINETLRLYGAAPGSLPRTVPEGGCTLGGFYIPGGITVCTQAYSMHRDESIFPNASSFDAFRFLSPLTSDQKTAFAPFGAGARTCLGVHLARMELRHATAEIFRECPGARLGDSTTDESMEIENYFLIAPVSKRCEITLREGGAPTH